jgi:hypothetical protein
VDSEIEDLETKLCDLMASFRKSRKNQKNKKHSKILFIMIGLFWNSRGFSNLPKFWYICDAVKENNLDFICKQDMPRSNLSRLTGDIDFVWHCLPPRGRSEGILLGVRADIFDLTLIVGGEFFRQIPSQQ